MLFRHAEIIMPVCLFTVPTPSFRQPRTVLGNDISRAVGTAMHNKHCILSWDLTLVKVGEMNWQSPTADS